MAVAWVAGAASRCPGAALLAAPCSADKAEGVRFHFLSLREAPR
jgi:hypothetical protein